MRTVATLLMLLICATLSSCKKPKPPVSQDTLSEKFGFGAMMMDGHQAIGDRPLFVAVVSVPGSTETFGVATLPDGTPDVSYYDKLMFGTGATTEKTLVNYFRSQSFGNFNYVKAGKGVYGPYTISSTSIPDQGHKAILEAAKEGLDFSQFDANHDGVVDHGELSILAIDNGSRRSGATRWGSCIKPVNSKGVTVCAVVAVAGGQSSFSTMVHEVSHTIGTHDLYGTNCHNSFLSLMTCTIYPYDHWMEIWGLDPWHKMVFGWIEPRPFDLPLYSPTNQIIAAAFASTSAPDNAQVFKRDETAKGTVISPKSSSSLLTSMGVDAAATMNSRVGGCAKLEAQQFTGGTSSEQQSPVLLYSSGIGVNNFLMLEYRNKYLTRANEYNFDINASGQGVAIWEIQTTGPASLAAIKGVDANNPGATDNANVTFGAPAGVRGGSVLWRPENGEFGVNWINGLDIGLKLKVGPITSIYQDAVDVEWGMGGMPAAQVDRLTTISFGKLALRGMLGVEAPGRKIVISSDTQSWEATVTKWSCESVNFDLPEGIPAGSYNVGVVDPTDNSYEDFTGLDL